VASGGRPGRIYGKSILIMKITISVLYNYSSFGGHRTTEVSDTQCTAGV